MLPAGHEKATDVQLARIASQVSADTSSDAQALLATVMDEEQELIEKVGQRLRDLSRVDKLARSLKHYP